MTAHAAIQRRRLLQMLSLGAISSSLQSIAVATEQKPPKKLQVAGYDYDRLLGLHNGSVDMQGHAYHYVDSTIGEMNTDVFSGKQQHDITEIGLHPYMLAYANEGFRDYVLLPIFPLRLFRHKSIFIRTDRGITKPTDLIGKKIATPGFSSTSLTWIRGLLQHEYGIKPSDVEWVIARMDSSAGLAGKPSQQENVLPEGLKFSNGPEAKDESNLLEDGTVDALFHAAEPRCYLQGHPKVDRLFSNYKATESAYYKKTGIFPIMHAVAIRKSLADQQPELVRAVFDAYVEAKKMAIKRLFTKGWVDIMLPWIGQEISATRALMGDDYWSYGIKGNEKTLAALCQYSHEQGLSKKQLKFRELFHPSCLDFLES